MVSLIQVLQALNSDETEMRESAAIFLVNEFKKSPSDLPANNLATIINHLNDENELVRRTIAKFVYSYAKAGKELSHAWLNLVGFTRSEDPGVRQLVFSSFSYIDTRSEQTLKKYLDNPAFGDKTRFLAAEALAHFYSRQKYFSSLSELLKKDSVVVKGAFSGFNYENSAQLVQKEDLQKVMPMLRDAQNRLAHDRQMPKREIARPIESRPKDRTRRA